MPIIPPDINLVVAAFTQFTSIAVLTSGGFKVVYRVEGPTGVEALKLIEIPNDPDIIDIETFRNEMFGRTRREIDALRRCAVPELVRLGTIDPVRIRLADREFVAYSEEFLSGSNLGQIMRSARNSNSFPPISELRLLLRSGLRVVEALWAQGYVHRDIKPLNVIKEGGTRQFVFLDLGIAFSGSRNSFSVN